MSKIIIENKSSVSDLSAISACAEVIKAGRISGDGQKKQYCYATRISMVGVNDLMIYATLNKSSDKLTVVDDYS